GAIREAFAHPRAIDENLVDAQQTRRIVDRLVGYTLSPLLSRKVRGGLSAGRVQSVAVRMVVEREREIKAFAPFEYWTLETLLETRGGDRFAAELVRIDGAKPEIGDAAGAEAHAGALRELRPRVARVAVSTRRMNPAPPFTTSTLQQESSRKLGFAPRRTMSVAQRLYEGVDTGEGQVGLVTYMRTDSTAMATVAMAEARDVIRARYGPPYVVPRGRVYRTKARGAQEAHESIRPTSFEREPDALSGHLKSDELRLYRLIWQRALASQMASKEIEATTVDLEAARYGLRASASRTMFDGFSRVYTEGRDDDGEELEGRLPALAAGDETAVVGVTPAQHFTEPPPRYTEATLIKALEDRGIGRPSTYAATISTIQDRGYVKLVDRRLRPEAVGDVVTDLLVEHFGEFVDPEFTARMEERLDEIARGEREWVPLLREFYGPLRDLVDEKRRELRRRDFTTEQSDEVCSLGHPMVVRLGRYGRFLSCSLYPEHQESRPLVDAGSDDGSEPPGDGHAPAERRLPGVGETCPECGQGTLVEKRGRFGPFAGCSRYPECTFIRKEGPPPPPALAFEVACPRCGTGHLVSRRARRTGKVFWGCSRYPSCDCTTDFEPVGARHAADAGPVGRRAAGGICLLCGASVPLPDGDLVGMSLEGGPPDPGALAPRRRGAGGKSAGGKSAGDKSAGDKSAGTGPRTRTRPPVTARRPGSQRRGDTGTA
ncbi:MAG TPA: type I DNA topoisomerase, partial [Candidatus Acidoferrales bacterium]|nr:type I DNA topoisomerase [Candidatus Acidoferrales bacterium]